MSSKPAILSCSLTVFGLPIENGPGPQVGSSESSGSGCSMNWSTISSARAVHGFSTFGRQTHQAIWPPGFSIACTFRNAATGFPKNITPMRENA